MHSRVRVGGVNFDVLTAGQVITRVADAIRCGQGGTIVTPNVDICRRASRDQVSRDLVAAGSIVVPDGMPLIWASRLAGKQLPERITGADLIFSLSEAAAARSWPVYLLGGLPGAGDLPGAAELAARNLAKRYPGLRVSGAYSPPASFDVATADIEWLLGELTTMQPSIVFVGLGFPKQEQLIARLTGSLPRAWFVGCGAAIPFAGGTISRAPAWMQRAGLEWVYRMISEPRRLARRYLLHDLPFAVWLLAVSALRREQPAEG